MPAIVISPGEGCQAPSDGELLCEVRVAGMVAAELGPFTDLMDAMIRVSESRYVLDAQEAEFRVVRAADRSFVCEFERRGLLMQREMEQEHSERR